MTEAELLFSHILDCDRLSLYLNRSRRLDKAKSLLLASVLKRRISGEPIQYILGKTEFMGLEFKVSRDVFIPRPETEILVETAINIVQSKESTAYSILELGTGSGCIAISLAKFLPDTNITATDISKEAIAISKQNALINNVKINFLLSDLFSNYELRTMNYELIICNPPYIPALEIMDLGPEVRHEPLIALDGGADGLDFYRRIIQGSKQYIKKDGFLIMECGFDQRERIENIFEESGDFQVQEVARDYSGIERVIVGKAKERWIN